MPWSGAWCGLGRSSSSHPHDATCDEREQEPEVGGDGAAVAALADRDPTDEVADALRLMTSNRTAPWWLPIFSATRSTYSSMAGMCTEGGIPEGRLRSRRRASTARSRC